MLAIIFNCGFHYFFNFSSAGKPLGIFGIKHLLAEGPEVALGKKIIEFFLPIKPIGHP